MSFYNYANRVTVPIDDALSQAVLKRLGKTEGEVRVAQENWNLGFCDTCDYPESGFAVYVDKELVWPNDEKINSFGGYSYADDEGQVNHNSLTTWGQFFNWLEDKNLERISQYQDLYYCRKDYPEELQEGDLEWLAWMEKEHPEECFISEE